MAKEIKKLPDFIFKLDNNMSDEDKDIFEKKIKEYFEGATVFFVGDDFQMHQLNDTYKKII